MSARNTRSILPDPPVQDAIASQFGEQKKRSPSWEHGGAPGYLRRTLVATLLQYLERREGPKSR